VSRGRFIALEGGEGAGKSTQIRLLAEYLEARGLQPLLTREPGGTPGGQALRRLLLAEGGASWTREAETLLMVADRAQHIAEVLEPALAAGRLVIGDRFVGSTLAYQGAGRGVDPDFIRELHRRACRGLWPDLTVVLDLDPRVGLARSRRRLAAEASDEARFEALDLGFHDRVRREFLALAADSVAPTIVVDAGREVDSVQEAIRAAVAPLLRVSSFGPDRADSG
jgi:dTMP kinase